MLDIGSWEFLIVIVIALIVIGPKDLPGLVRTVSQWVRRARELAREFQGGLEDMAREAELDKVKDSLQAELDPDGMVNSIKRDIEDDIEAEWLEDETAFDFEDAERAKEDGTEDAPAEEGEDADAPAAAHVEADEDAAAAPVEAGEDAAAPAAAPDEVGEEEAVVAKSGSGE